MINNLLKTACVLTACCSVTSIQAQPPALNKDAIVQASLIADTTAVNPGDTFTVGVLFKIQPDWHIYAENPGSSGLPTTVKWGVPDGVTAGKTIYPKPVTFGEDNSNNGYATETLLTMQVRADKAPANGKIEVTADAAWLMCNNSCIRNSKKLSIVLPVGKGESANKDVFAKYRAQTAK